MNTIESSEINGAQGSLFNTAFMACGKVTLSTGGGIQVIDAPKVKTGDLVLVTLVSDDSGTAITSILGVASNGLVTITRTDDASSNDDAVAQYLVVRPAVV